MISFHGRQDLKDQLVSNLLEHQRLDHFQQGIYWDNITQKGCDMGCSIIDFGGDVKANVHQEYERIFGIPRIIPRLRDSIFEGLSVEDSTWFSLASTKATPVGKDLSLVWPKFAVWLLNDVEKYATESGKKAINRIIELYSREISGKHISKAEWRAAADDAADAADDDAADAAAVAAAYAGAYAAEATDAVAAVDAAVAVAYAAAAVAYGFAAAAVDAADADDAAYAADAAAAGAARKDSRKAQALKLIEILKGE